MKRKILQKIADAIIIKISTATDPAVIQSNYDFGLWFDGLCVNYFKVSLD